MVNKKYTNDENEAPRRMMKVHVVKDGECVEMEVTDMRPEWASNLEINNEHRSFDRAELIEDSWHFADHGEWRHA